MHAYIYIYALSCASLYCSRGALLMMHGVQAATDVEMRRRKCIALYVHRRRSTPGGWRWPSPSAACELAYKYPWFYHAGEWLYLKRQPYEDREDAIVILCADGEQVASVADEDLYKYDGVQETTARFVCAGQLTPRGPHRLTASVCLLNQLLLMNKRASPHVLQDWTNHLHASCFDDQMCADRQTSRFAGTSANRMSN
jgi:hypothetical protein